MLKSATVISVKGCLFVITHVVGIMLTVVMNMLGLCVMMRIVCNT